MPADLVDLMQRYCDGDRAAFDELYREVSPRVFAYLTRLTGDRGVAEDLLQTTFLKVHRARRAYVRGAAPLPWIYAIAHRTFLDEARRRKRARVRVARDPEAISEVPVGIGGQSEESTDSGVDPEMARAALAALDTLPTKQREAVVLIKLGGKSVAEAAEIAGTTRGAMKVRAHRGYEALRRALRSDRGETT